MVLSSLTTFQGLPSLEEIEFGLLSPEEILALSVCEITSTKLTGSHSVYDERMGVLENGKKCVTCEQSAKDCVGHFGHIPLAMDIIHPLYQKHLLSVLKCICFQCSRLLYTHEQLELYHLNQGPRMLRFPKIVEKMDRVFICSHCQTFQPKYTYSNTEKVIYMVFKWEGEITKVVLDDHEALQILSRMHDTDLEEMGFDKSRFHPKNMVLTVLPVLPPVARPYVISDSVTCDDDLTIQYLEITKANFHLQDPTASEAKRHKYIQILKFRIKSLFDNSSGSSKHSNGRPLKGIKKRLTGKEGLLRNNLMGKRVDKSARSVIGPDPTLKSDEIAIPPEIADILSYPVRLNRYNKELVKEWIQSNKVNYILRDNGNTRINVKYALYRQGTRLEYGDDIVFPDGRGVLYKHDKQPIRLTTECTIYRRGKKMENFVFPAKKNVLLQEGDIIERKLMDGDILLLNRQPTLHKGSMIAQKVKIRPGKTIRMNLAITKTFNADFDGDEMNLHCPASVETETELRELSSLKNHLVSNQSSKANIVIVQDSMTGSYLMTREFLEIPIASAFQMLISLPSFNPEDIEKKMKSYMDVRKRHPDVFQNVPLWNGRFVFSFLFPDSFFYEFGQVKIEQGILWSGAITKANLGGSHTSFITLLNKEYSPERCIQFIDEVQFLSNAFLMWRGFSVGISDCVIRHCDEISNVVHRAFIKSRAIEESVQDPVIREAYISRALSSARDTGMVIAKQAMAPTNNFISTVTSGSKGDYFNIGQITGLLGQQYLNGDRIQPTLSGEERTLCYYPFKEDMKSDDDMKYESQGFVKNSFIHGINPREFFFHAMTGREGITDTAMKTATSGYIQRRMIKLTEDVTIQYDGSVRSVNKGILQFIYGESGLDPSKTGFMKEKAYSTEFSRLAERLNYEYESNLKI
jgi:DNA-directed RNA polymerase beta' subunit